MNYSMIHPVRWMVATARLMMLSALGWPLLLAPSAFCGEAPSNIVSVPVASFAARPQIAEMHLSPNGKELAVLRQVNEGGHGLFVIDLDTLKARQLINPAGEVHVANARWLDDDWLTFQAVSRHGVFAGFGRVAAAGGALVNDKGWYDDTCTYLDPVRGPPRRDGTAWALCAGRDGVVVRIQDLKTGKFIPATRHDRSMGRFVIDHAGVVRAGVECVEKVASQVCTAYYRDNDIQPWGALAEWSTGEAGALIPLAFDFGNRSMLVAANPDGGTLAVHRWDVRTRALGERVFGHPSVDVDDVILSFHDKKVIGVRYHDGRPQVHWLDPDRAGLQHELSALFPGEFVSVEFSDDGHRALVFVASDRNPGEWHLYLPERQELKFLGKRQPRIDSKLMAPQEPIRFKARDGLEIHGYLTRPSRTAPGGAPLVVAIHGGPFGFRDGWGFNPETQFFASRGYAVLQVNFRGSPGYGPAFERAGWGQWGLKMQDDITDGVRWAVAQGIADPEQVCIYGASYGGYAALMGLIKTPELYRCGIAYAAVADLVTLYRQGTKRYSNLFYWFYSDQQDQRRAWFRRAIGGNLNEAGPLSARSPVHLADQIKAPLLVVHGGRDWTVPYREHAYLLRNELEKRGRKVGWLFEEEGGHGFQDPALVAELYRKMEEFLAAHLK